MCGRYRITRDGREYWRFFRGGRGETGRWIEQDVVTGEQTDPLRTWAPRPEVKPTEQIPVFRLQAGEVNMRMMTWWLCPPWGRDRIKFYTARDGYKSFRWLPGRAPGTHFNTRFDTLTSDRKSYWWKLLESKRCVLPADGFIEWPDVEIIGKSAPKIPKLFALKGSEPFFFPGLWEVVEDDDGAPFLSTNLITVGPNQMLIDLPHKRMPAILKTPEEVRGYLEAESAEAAAGFLQPTPADLMEALPWP